MEKKAHVSVPSLLLSFYVILSFLQLFHFTSSFAPSARTRTLIPTPPILLSHSRMCSQSRKNYHDDDCSTTRKSTYLQTSSAHHQNNNHEEDEDNDKYHRRRRRDPNHKNKNNEDHDIVKDNNNINSNDDHDNDNSKYSIGNENENENDNRMSEFGPLEPRQITQLTQLRMKKEQSTQSHFVRHGNALWELRSSLVNLSKQLIHIMSQRHIDNQKKAKGTSNNKNDDVNSISSSSSSSTMSMNTSKTNGFSIGNLNNNNNSNSNNNNNIINNDVMKNASEKEVRRLIRVLESKDADLVYKLELEEMEDALRENRYDDANEHEQKAVMARSVLPQFNLHGLWVGQYGNSGYQMINVTYIGDTLVAYKVTGDNNIPSNEITFQTDLNPLQFKKSKSKQKPSSSSSSNLTNKDKVKKRKRKGKRHQHHQPLPNILLSKEASQKWNTNEISRHTGLGHVAEEGFVNSQWMEGEMININKDYFSFVWLPIQFQVLFGRPSNDLIIQMLAKEKEKEKEEMELDEVDREIMKNIGVKLTDRNSIGNVVVNGDIDIVDDDDDDDDVFYVDDDSSLENDLSTTFNQHIVKCMEVTNDLINESSIQDDLKTCIFYDDDLDNCCFE